MRKAKLNSKWTAANPFPVNGNMLIETKKPPPHRVSSVVEVQIESVFRFMHHKLL